MKILVRKVLVYCVSEGRLLVFRHADVPPHQVGLQVPGGSLREGETPAEAARRELREETGRADFELEHYVGSAFYDISPYRWEVQERLFFRARPTAALPERWFGAEEHDGKAPVTRLEFFWIALAHAHILQAGQGALIATLAM